MVIPDVSMCCNIFFGVASADEKNDDEMIANWKKQVTESEETTYYACPRAYWLRE